MYLLICMQSSLYFAALQPFLFGMRYLQSATRYALSESYLTLNCIYYVTITVAIFYSAAMIGLMLLLCLTYPGPDAVMND
jgi:hypothetical protein